MMILVRFYSLYYIYVKLCRTKGVLMKRQGIKKQKNHKRLTKRPTKGVAMAYDATKMADWQISEAAEERMKSVWQLGDEMGLKKDEVIAYGRIGRVDFMKITNRLKNRPDGKYIEVTAITPTPLGEGKTTTSMGLIEGLGKRGKNVGRCHTTAFRRAHYEYQRERGGRRQRTGDPFDGVLSRSYGRHQQYRQCP